MCAATVTCVGLTGDGQCVLVNTLANCLYLIDKTTGELLNEYVVTAHSVCVKLIFFPESDAINVANDYCPCSKDDHSLCLSFLPTWFCCLTESLPSTASELILECGVGDARPEGPRAGDGVLGEMGFLGR